MAERNFDEEFKNDEKEGHSFVLGGYTFHVPPVIAPGVFLAAGSVRGLSSAITFLRRAVVQEERADLERILEMPDTSAGLIDLAPELLSSVMMLLAAEDLDKGRDEALTALREVAERAIKSEPRDGPDVSAAEVDEVAHWLMEVTIGRPTSSPTPSGNGAGRTSAGSKATSSPRAKAGKT